MLHQKIEIQLSSDSGKASSKTTLTFFLKTSQIIVSVSVHFYSIELEILNLSGSTEDNLRLKGCCSSDMAQGITF